MNIEFYDHKGKLRESQKLSNSNLVHTIGMMTKIILKDKSVHVGYSDPYRMEGKQEEYDGDVHDYMYLWTLNNINEEFPQEYNILKDGINIEKIDLDEIFEVKAILYSGLRFGCHLTNSFFIDKIK